jgi:hypothetical protein
MSPFLMRRGYDGNSVAATTAVWLSPENRMTPMWESGFDLAGIVRF